MCREESRKGVISPKVHCVAVIEDDDDLREGVASLLVAEGYDVLCFPTVNELLRIRETHVDCLIVGIEGAFAASIILQLQLSDAIGKTRVIYVGNDIPNAMASMIMRRGATAVLNKPVRGRVLLAALQAAIKTDR